MKIKVPENKCDEAWSWCCDHLENGTWKTWIGFLPNGRTFEFDNESDATFFCLACL